MTKLLPEGVSESSFAEALKAFANALTDDRVLSSPEAMAEFRDPFEPPSWELFLPSAVVLPTTVEEVRAVVGIANDHGIPLWTHGQGRNNAYGGAAPRVK